MQITIQMMRDIKADAADNGMTDADAQAMIADIAADINDAQDGDDDPFKGIVDVKHNDGWDAS